MSIKLIGFGFQCNCKYVKLYVSVSEAKFGVVIVGAAREGEDMQQAATSFPRLKPAANG